jgi:hypothetical protein
MAPMFKIEANKLKVVKNDEMLLFPSNSAGKQRFSGCREDRGPVSPIENPNERAPQDIIKANRKVRVRVAGVIGSSSAPAADER